MEAGHAPEALGANVSEDAGRNAVNVPTGTVTFLFTDIQGSTAMWERNPTRMEAALARHDEIVRTVVESNGGYVFKTVGDAFCAAFTIPRQALDATLAAQRALGAEEWGETPVRVRTALHTGATEERNGDYFGPPVNRVARLLSTGHGGQILLSAVTYGLVRDSLGFLGRGAELRDMGEHRLRDLTNTERIYQLVVPDLPSEFPALKTLDSRSGERYTLIRPLGGGGMAEVYLARDEELDRDVALKELRHQYAGDEQFVERFAREAKNAASLSHPNIVQVYDRGKFKDGTYYIVMEHVSGGTLKERILTEGPLPARTVAALTQQVALALRVAHERGVIHRDIKPQNILLTESGEAKVADFGIARAASSTTMTESGVVVGTTFYLSPEQSLGQPASPQSDLYSLGVVVYEMLTGEVPYDAETPVGVAMKHIGGNLRAPKEVREDVPDEMNALTVRLMARDPRDRYQSADQLLEDLERVGRGEPPALAASQQNVSPQDGMPVSPYADPGGGSPPPQSPPREPEGMPPGPPPPARPGEGASGEGQPRRRRKVPWMLAGGLLGVVALLAAAILLVGQFVSGGEGNSSAAPGYTLVKDDSGNLSVEVPSEWDAVDGTTWDFKGGKVGLSVIATTNLDAWYRHNYFHKGSTEIDESPGVLFGLSRSLVDEYPKNTEDNVLDLKSFNYTDICRSGGTHAYDDGVYTGKYELWKNCGKTGADAFVLAALPSDRAYVVVIQLTTKRGTSLKTQKHILDTFKVSDEL
jgi:serine/threonine protein kinase/class 3 adenylate cyclase